MPEQVSQGQTSPKTEWTNSQQDDYRRSVVELFAPREAPKTQRRPRSISLDVQDVMKEN